MGFVIKNTNVSRELLVSNFATIFPISAKTCKPSNYNIENLAGGEYFHFDAILAEIERHKELRDLSSLSIQVNTDGMPLYYSRAHQINSGPF